jgi:hypothetical protein
MIIMLRLTTMQAKGMAKSKLRKAVTGDPDKKIRDYMTEVPQVELTAASLFWFLIYFHQYIFIFSA